jgi:hypothetical protein
VNGHHGIEKEREVDALGLNRQLEIVAVAVKGPWSFCCRDVDVGLIVAIEETVL